jgi:cation/acetate symporter
MSLMIGTAGLPHVIIRFFTVPKVKDARASAFWALLFISILYTTAPAVAGMARLNMINTIETTQGENLKYDERPQWFKNWEKTGLLQFEDKNGDGRIQYVADPEKNEMVKIDRDSILKLHSFLTGSLR